MRSRIWIYLLLIISSLLLFLATACLGAFSHVLKYIAGGILYALIVYWATLKMPAARMPKLMPLICFLVPMLVLIALFCIRKFGILGLPSTLSLTIGALVGYVAGILPKRVSLYVLLVFTILCLFSGKPVYTNWLHKMNFGAFTSVVQEPLPGFEFTTTGGQQLSKDAFAGKIVVVDFWNTSCSVCYEQFPILEKLSEKYKENGQISIYAVNIPLMREDINSSRRYLTKYQFLQLLAPDNTAEALFGIQSYPTVLVIKNGIITRRGDLESAKQEIEDYLANTN